MTWALLTGVWLSCTSPVKEASPCLESANNAVGVETVATKSARNKKSLFELNDNWCASVKVLE